MNLQRSHDLYWFAEDIDNAGRRRLRFSFLLIAGRLALALPRVRGAGPTRIGDAIASRSRFPGLSRAPTPEGP
jgi:hypothetical protein